MTPRRRKALMLGAVLLAFASIIGWRLDAEVLKANLTAQLSQYSAASLHVESMSLSFMHGIGVRLNQVSIDHPDCQIQAKHINISMRLIPLLLGKAEIDALDIHDAVFKLKSNTMRFDVQAIASLPVARINLIRSRIEAADGSELLNHMRLELRGIGSEHETLWELNAQEGQQALSGHGRILFHQGNIKSSFGKLKLSNMPVAKLRTFAPPSLMGWIEGEGNTLSGSLTMDMTQRQTWAIFGSMLLNNETTALSATLRGKLSHPAAGQLIWKDSFIHLDNKAVIAITGSCQQDRCTTTLDAKHIALQHWHPFIPKGINFHRSISGHSDLMAALQWDNQTWQGTATLKLDKASFQHQNATINLPVLNLDVHELSGDHQTWTANASITSANASGTISIQNEQQSNGYQHLQMQTTDADSKLWQPLANLLLASLDLQATLQAKGKVQGSLHIHQLAERKRLVVDIDATAAQINYAPWLNKKAEVVAVCQATIRLADSIPYSTHISDCQLDASRLTKLVWSQKKGQQQLSVDQLNLDLDSLQAQTIALPETFKGFSGILKGSGQSAWQDQQDWTKNMHGNWQLQHVGTDAWQAHGHVQIDKGAFRSQHMLIAGIYGKAELKGEYNLSKQRGKVDVLSGVVDWNSLPTLPSAWQQLSLHGNIKQTELTFLHNNWHDLRSNYTLDQSDLRLKKLQASLAGGTITSNSLTLSPQPEGLNIQGHIRANNIQLDQLQGLREWIQADMRGSLHANIKLAGSIPQISMNNWQRSNGDILIYSGDWRQQLQAKSLTERLGIKPPVLKTYAFKKLEFRFNIHADKADISNIRVLRHEQLYRGKASINADFHLRGRSQHTTDKSSYVIDSTLPKINWTSQR